MRVWGREPTGMLDWDEGPGCGQIIYWVPSPLSFLNELPSGYLVLKRISDIIWSCDK